ncbi:thermonuclease family protein [Almyronema epifaneia S1]|uniref:Thermonuclease family protein n=1 Tax=Almyronema epifaneia S1 TaxID=2991925 RepID=A0ABW6ICZ9_9CYAN
MEQGERLGLLGNLAGDRLSDNLYTVDSVQGLLLTVHQPNQPPVQCQLAGLTEPDERWRDEATGILSMLVQASQNRVTISFTETKQPDSVASALVQLPTGAYVQQILLLEGVAQLDRTQPNSLPTETAQMFQQAEALAQAERKNIWSRN